MHTAVYMPAPRVQARVHRTRRRARAPTLRACTPRAVPLTDVGVLPTVNRHAPRSFVGKTAARALRLDDAPRRGSVIQLQAL